MDTNNTFSVAIRPQVAHECISGEVIMLNLDTGMYHTLNDTAGFIWMQLAEELPLETIVAQFSDHWAVSRDVASTMISQFLTELEQKDLVDIAGAPPAWMKSGTAHSDEHIRTDIWPLVETYDDMRAALLLDPIHDVDDTGWPNAKPPTRHGDPT